MCVLRVMEILNGKEKEAKQRRTKTDTASKRKTVADYLSGHAETYGEALQGTFPCGCPDGGQGLAGAGSKLYAGAAGQYKAFRRGKAASEALEKREETAGRNAAEL